MSGPFVLDTLSVFFGGIDDKVITQEMVRKDFEHCGEIIKVTIPRDKGCMFIQFKRPEMASFCIDHMHKVQMSYYRGFRVTVNHASDRRKTQAAQAQIKSVDVEQIRATAYNDGYEYAMRQIARFNTDLANWLDRMRNSQTSRQEYQRQYQYQPTDSDSRVDGRSYDYQERTYANSERTPDEGGSSDGRPVRSSRSGYSRRSRSRDSRSDSRSPSRERKRSRKDKDELDDAGSVQDGEVKIE